MNPHTTKNILKDVRFFWERNPLFQGESNYEVGTPEFFEEHRRIYIEDCFAGALDQRLFPIRNDALILDLGCGPGFWTVEFLLSSKCKKIVAADLTLNALQIAKKRLKVYKVDAGFAQANAEILPFASNSFDHVNCQGVIHHTPNTEQCLDEIARILKPGGSCLISVYYRNLFLRHWNKMNWIGKLLLKLGAKFHGRGRENIFAQSDVNEIVRLYDGADNPLGKAYSKQEFIGMLKSHFRIRELFYHFFPARSLPIAIPRWIHGCLDRNLPFMIFANLTKRK